MRLSPDGMRLLDLAAMNVEAIGFLIAVRRINAGWLVRTTATATSRSDYCRLASAMRILCQIAQDARPRRAGKQSTLIVYPGLGETSPGSAARADMLRRSDAFLRASLHMPAV